MALFEKDDLSEREQARLRTGLVKILVCYGIVAALLGAYVLLTTEPLLPADDGIVAQTPGTSAPK